MVQAPDVFIFLSIDDCNKNIRMHQMMEKETRWTPRTLGTRLTRSIKYGYECTNRTNGFIPKRTHGVLFALSFFASKKMYILWNPKVLRMFFFHSNTILNRKYQTISSFSFLNSYTFACYFVCKLLGKWWFKHKPTRAVHPFETTPCAPRIRPSVAIAQEVG